MAPLLCGAVGWVGLALWFDGPASRPLAGTLVGGFVLAVVAVLTFVRPRRRVDRPAIVPGRGQPAGCQAQVVQRVLPQLHDPIRFHVKQAAVHNPWDWRILVNGKADELLYHRGTIDTSLPFAEVRARSDITAKAKAKAADQNPDFSQRIREGLLPRPGAP